MVIDATRDFRWIGTQLYLRDEKLPYKLLEHVSYPNMFYCKTSNGTSLDFYNISRARQHLIELYRKDKNMGDIFKV